nr:AzlC family ABC transporter permease [bacterium]
MGTKKAALRAAFPLTLPILAGFTVLGMAFGVLLTRAGYAPWWAPLMSVVIFGGSIQYVAVGLLTAGFAPLYALLMALMVNARHLFYGITMLDKFRDTGKFKFYLIFGMCDETFSILATTPPPEGVDKRWFMFFVTLLDHLYWILGSALGALIGGALPFSTQGMDFVLTALFAVIFLNQWRDKRGRISALIGLAVPAVCLLIFGADTFLLPAMGALLVALTVLRRPLERGQNPV